MIIRGTGVDCLLGLPMAACMVVPLLVASAGTGHKHRAWQWSLLFLGLFVLDQAMLYLPVQMQLNGALRLHWNWLGKLFVLAWVIP